MQASTAEINGHSEVVLTAGWRCNSTKTAGTPEVTYNATSYGSCSFPQPAEGGTFTPYASLTQAQALTGAKDFIMSLQPKKWQWWDGSGEGVGFIAHEFMEVAKYSGTGAKDAVETVEIKDEQGSVTGTEQRPVMQSIQPSSSEVMANLVSFIQELNTRLTALENK